MWSYLAIIGLLVAATQGGSLRIPIDDPPPSLVENKAVHVDSNKAGVFADEYRLPNTVLPSHYKIYIRPNVYEEDGEDFLKAPGNVTITVRSTGTSNNITLHRDETAIAIDEENVVVRRTNGDAVGISAHNYDVAKHFYIIQLSSNLVENAEYEIVIPYTVQMSNTITNGLFAASYVDPANPTETRYLAATHFEPARARKMFPSFDEPNLKARFELVIGRKNTYHSLSNMEIRETTADPTLPWVWDHYNMTEVMSSYLVALAVSDYASETAPSDLYGKPVKTWAAQYLIDQQGGVFASKAAAQILDFYNKTFDIDYVFPKMDSVVVPPFGGAMENWGLNVYGQNALIYIPGKSTEDNKRSIANVIAHELAHQWFGNLVTCAWWSDIWLNEGFATYVSFMGEEIVAPELEASERFYLNVIPAAMGYDHGGSTHPVKVAVDNPVTGSKFTTIVYEKGAALIQMMVHTFGKDLFFQGVKDYLKGMAFEAAEQDDLFRYLQPAVVSSLPADLSVKDFMDTWTLQTGYPLVRASAVGSSIYLSQEVYFADLLQPATQEEPRRWHIPIPIITKSDTNPSTAPREWLRRNELQKSLSNLDTTQWIVVNPDGVGYYRVQYDETLARLLWAQLNSDSSVFSTVTRAKFMDDYFNLATAGYVTIDHAMEFTKYLTQEVKRVPWNIFLIHFAKFFDLAEDHAAGKTLIRRYLAPKFESLLTKINHEQGADEIGSNVTLRSIIYERACPMGYEGCLTYAEAKFREWRDATDGSNPFPVDLRAVLYCGAVAGPSRAEAIQFFLDKYKAETDVTHRTQLLYALACSPLEDDHSSLLKLVEDPNSGIAENQRVSLVQRIISKSVGRGVALSYIKTNLAATGSFVTPQVYAEVVNELSNFAYREFVIQDIKTHMNLEKNVEILAPVQSRLDAALARMEANKAWMERIGNPAFTWMQNNLN